DDKVVAERWADYPTSPAAFLNAPLGPGKLVNRIEWIKYLEPRERVEALERGEVDCIHGPDYEDVARLEADDRFRVVRFSQASNAYLGLNWDRTDLGFDDVRVRRAIAAAIDRDTLVQKAVLGYGRGTWGPISPGGEFYEPIVEQGRQYDPSGAAVDRDRAGWTLGDDGIRAKNGVRMAFECVLQDDTIHKRIAEGLCDQLRTIGVIVELNPVRSFEAFYKAALS